MSDALDRVQRSVDEQHRSESALTRRGCGRDRGHARQPRPAGHALANAAPEGARRREQRPADDPEHRSHGRGAGDDRQHRRRRHRRARPVTIHNVRAAAREELIHYNYLKSRTAECR